MAKAVRITSATGEKLAQRAKVDVPIQPRHEVVDLALRQHAQRIEAGFLEFCLLAQEAIEGAYYTKYGYTDPEPYFQDRIGVAYRTVRRRLQIVEGLLRLPDAEREPAKAALATLGGHKAAEVARLMGRDDGWQDLANRAADMTEDAVRDEASARLGSKPRGLPDQPGEPFLRFLLSRVPVEVQEHVEAVMRGIMRRFELTNAVAAFIILVDLGHQELAAWEARKE